MRLHRLPRALVLHVKRFKYSGTTREKLNTSLSFPLRELRLDQFASEEAPLSDRDALYDLYAVCNHYGSMQGGHYTSYCRVNEEGREQWYNFNDEVVTKANANNVVSANAYILFYARRT